MVRAGEIARKTQVVKTQLQSWSASRRTTTKCHGTPHLISHACNHYRVLVDPSRLIDLAGMLNPPFLNFSTASDVPQPYSAVLTTFHDKANTASLICPMTSISWKWTHRNGRHDDGNSDRIPSPRLASKDRAKHMHLGEEIDYSTIIKMTPTFINRS